MLLSTWYPVIRSFSHVYINYNEGWNAYRAAWAMNGVPLYGEQSPYQLTNYPPISFYVVGWLGRLNGDVIQAGRLLSLASLLAIAVLIAMIAQRFAGFWRLGWYAAICFVLWLAKMQPDRIGMNDPHLFATVLSLMGLYGYVRRQDSDRWLWFSAVAFVLSLFTKHSLLAFPAAAAADMLMTRSFKKLAIWTAISCALAAVLLAVTLRFDGPYLFAQLTAPRPYSLGHAAAISGRYVWIFQLPLAAAVVWLVCRQTDKLRRLPLVAFVLAHGLAVAFSGGFGIDGNIFFDCFIATVLLVAFAAGDVMNWTESRPHGNWLLTTALLAPFIGLAATAPGEFVRDYAIVQQLAAQETQLGDAIADVAAIPGPVMCMHPMICFEAGKTDEFETFAVEAAIRTGRLSQEDFLALVDAGHLDAIEASATRGQSVAAFEQLDGLGSLLFQRFPKMTQNGQWAIFHRR